MPSYHQPEHHENRKRKRGGTTKLNSPKPLWEDAAPVSPYERSHLDRIATTKVQDIMTSMSSDIQKRLLRSYKSSFSSNPQLLSNKQLQKLFVNQDSLFVLLKAAVLCIGLQTIGEDTRERSELHEALKDILDRNDITGYGVDGVPLLLLFAELERSVGCLGTASTYLQVARSLLDHAELVGATSLESEGARNLESYQTLCNMLAERTKSSQNHQTTPTAIIPSEDTNDVRSPNLGEFSAMLRDNLTWEGMDILLASTDMPMANTIDMPSHQDHSSSPSTTPTSSNPTTHDDPAEQISDPVFGGYLDEITHIRTHSHSPSKRRRMSNESETADDVSTETWRGNDMAEQFRAFLGHDIGIRGPEAFDAAVVHDIGGSIWGGGHMMTV